MPLFTYGDLQTSVLNWLARPGDSKISATVPDMITLFENEANRRIRSIYNETSATLTVLPTDTAGALLPADYLETRSVRLSSVSPRRQLEFLTTAQFDGSAIADESGPPRYYTIANGLLGPAIQLGPNPDITYQLIVRYYTRIPSLRVNTSNWLLLAYNDAYLFGTLAEAEAFIGHDERVVGWLQRRDLSLDSINVSGQKALYGGVPLTIRTDTGNP